MKLPGVFIIAFLVITLPFSLFAATIQTEIGAVISSDCWDHDADQYDDCACFEGRCDCDDSDPTTRPFADDPCYDGIDQNCDGFDGSREGCWKGVDDDCDGFVDCDDWGECSPVDEDGDGWSPCHGDCDDANPAVNPSAFEDPCNDIDDDCDGHIEFCCPCCFLGAAM